MAFAQLAGTDITEEVLNVTTHNFGVVAGTLAGELLLMLSAVDGSPTISGMQGGWTSLAEVANASGGMYHAWFRFATGSDVAGQFTTSAAETSRNTVFRFTGAHLTAAPEEANDGGYAGTVNPDPPLLDPTWAAAEDTVFLVFDAHDGAGTASAFPTNYDDNQETGSAGSVSSAVATRELAADSDDPGTFTITVSDTGVVATIGIRPAAAVVAGGGGGGLPLIFA